MFLSTPKTDEACDHGFAWAALLEHFYARQELTAPALTLLKGEQMIEPYKELLVHSSDDKISDPENSVVMYLAFKRAGIPAELHVYSSGDHDFGVRQNEKLPSSWTGLCERWLQSHQLLKTGE